MKIINKIITMIKNFFIENFLIIIFNSIIMFLINYFVFKEPLTYKLIYSFLFGNLWGIILIGYISKKAFKNINIKKKKS